MTDFKITQIFLKKLKILNMKKNKIFLLILLLIFFQNQLRSQTDTIIKDEYLNFATLIVDYDTYNFEGGNLSYYQICNSCTNDSLPFDIVFNPPGDFGDITYRIQTTFDTVFFGTIVWAGTGQMYYPNNFDLNYPFNTSDTLIEKPINIEYFGINGTKVNDDTSFIQKADSAWDKIDSLEITKLFAEKNYKAGIFLYAPTVGMFDPYAAKWIVFLYYNNNSTSIFTEKNTNLKLLIHPNPTKDFIYIKTEKTNNKMLKIIDISGRIVYSKKLNDNIEQIDISDYSKGVYFISVKSDEFIKTEKIIKY